jgi:hypothetical protein
MLIASDFHDITQFQLDKIFMVLNIKFGRVSKIEISHEIAGFKCICSSFYFALLLNWNG